MRTYLPVPIEDEIVDGQIVEDLELELEAIQDARDWCDLCTHFHPGDGCPSTPCGDYRCCIN